MLRAGVSLLALGTLALASCSDDILFEPNLTDNAFDASTTQLAVLSVHPWEEIAPQMKPNFELTAEEAKKQVLPTTSAYEQRILDLFTASAGIAASSQTGREQAASGAGASDKQLAVPTPTLVTSIAANGNVTTAATPSDVFKLTNDPNNRITANVAEEQDPIITHQLANALLQEVAQLNTMVERIATREGYEPYLVRMQLTNMPFVRHQPYDIYVNLSFFNDTLRDANGAVRRDQNADQPLVIPLLVTDNIEGSLQSRTARVIRQLSVAFKFALEGVAGNLDAVRLKDKLDAVLGVDQNSLFTIGRSSENSIQVRLGAPLNPTSRYAMVPRTHNISLVVMVNRKHLMAGRDAKWMKGPQVKAYMTTEYRNATDRDNVLKGLTRADQLAAYQPIEHLLQREPGSSRSHQSKIELLDKIFGVVGENNYKKFESVAGPGNGTGWYIAAEDTARFVWAEMAKVVAKSRFAFATFELPAPIEPKIANSLIRRVKDGSSSRSDWARNACGDAWSGMADAKTVRDDDLAGDDYGPTHALLVNTGAGTNVQIGNISGFSDDRLNAVLVVRNQNSERLEIPARRVNIHKLGSDVATPDVLDLEFPPLAALNISGIKSQGSYLRMTYAPPKWRSRNGPYRFVVCALKYASPSNAVAGVVAAAVTGLPAKTFDINSSDAVLEFTDVDDLDDAKLEILLQSAEGYFLKPKEGKKYDDLTRTLTLKFDKSIVSKLANSNKSTFSLNIIVNPTYSEALRGYKRRRIQTGDITYLPPP